LAAGFGIELLACGKIGGRDRLQIEHNHAGTMTPGQFEPPRRPTGLEDIHTTPFEDSPKYLTGFLATVHNQDTGA